MSKKISITLDDQSLRFVDQRTSNRSAFINSLLLKEQKRLFLRELAKAYEEQAQDVTVQTELAAWDVVVGDGLNA
ncbi:MAG: hypothetical protein WBB82_14165 [Limnothrix sp.]